MNKGEQLQQLYEEWADCGRCRLCQTRKNVVFGEGNPEALLMVVGEAPTEEDDRTGGPFSGTSGKLIEGFLEANNMTRDDVFITHVVSCRPVDAEDPRKGSKPGFAEIQACFPRLQRLIEIVDPFVVLVLGDVALKTLSSDKKSVMQAMKDPHMQAVEIKTLGRSLPVPRTGFACFSPNYLFQHWSTEMGGPLELAYRVWKRAVDVADTHALVFRGITPPDRGDR